MSTILYQFPLSHFCEKVRWALDYKGIDYRIKNLLPGLHLKTTTKIAANSSVPVLLHNGRVIQDSSKIISYLDEQFPGKKLTPVNSQHAQVALEWERYLDSEVGVPLRRYVYHTLLQHRRLVIGFFATGGPFWAKPLLHLIYPTLAKKMRRYMDINEASAAQARLQLQRAMKRINEAVGERKYLAGEHFSRADLTASALLAPLFMPPQYGLRWPTSLPQPLQGEIDAMAPQLQWAREIYAKHR